MTWNSPDRHSLDTPSMAIPPERVERLIGAVLARLDEFPGPVAARAHGTGSLVRWLAGMIPEPRFAMPMAAAAALGIVVGQHLQAAEAAVQFADLFSYTSLYALGF